MNKIEINIDSTVLGSAGCIKQLILKTVGTIENGEPTGGYKEFGVPIKMGYGICVHKFTDVMYIDPFVCPLTFVIVPPPDPPATVNVRLLLSVPVLPLMVIVREQLSALLAFISRLLTVIQEPANKAQQK